MKLTPNTITEHHVIECNSKRKQIATFDALIKMGYDVNEEVRLGYHNIDLYIRWSGSRFITCPTNLKKINNKPLIPITLNDLENLNNKPMKYNKETLQEGVEEGFELKDKDYIYCGCYEVVESTANWLFKKGFNVSFKWKKVIGNLEDYDCLSYTSEYGWDINKKHQLSNSRQIHIEDLERVKPKRELPEINGYKGKIQGDEIVYNNCARLLIDWFKGSENRIISAMQLNTGVWITEKKIEQISNYLKQEGLI